ncbi:MAG: cytidylate kinase-like family protein [Clostridiales bacterium]|nr:cytidylate kinase-like family protein [Clostridiales bacterium]
MKNTVITIGREYGSGGLEIGRKLAEKLGIKCYDKELLTIVAQDSGFCEEVIKKNDEHNGSFLYSLVTDTYSPSGYGMGNYFNDLPLNHKVFLAQFDTIRKLAAQESCIIVGRCADYALKDTAECISVFIHADMDFRIPRVKADNPDKNFRDDNKVMDYINRIDRKRANYYNYFSNKKWADARSYDLSISSSRRGIDEAVDVIAEYVKRFQ